MSGIRVSDWRPVKKGALLGFARAELPSGLILVDVTILSGERGPWASPPSKPMVGRDGTVMKDANGKTRYSSVVEFTSKEVRERFSSRIIEALKVAYPDALASGGST